MADGFTVEIDLRGYLAALARFPAVANRHLKPAAKVTADAVQRNGRAIIARRTGATAAGIIVREDYTGRGYIVTTADTLSDQAIAARKKAAATNRNLRRRANARYTADKHVGLWLEGGTVRGEPRSHTSPARPWLYPASKLEEGPHRRRVAAALEGAIAEVGMSR